MLKNELKRLYNQRFTGLLTISLVVLYLLLNMLPLYSSEYRVYKENLNSNHNTISQYYEEQSHYLLSFEDEVEAKLNNIGQQLESPLFKDEKSQVRLQAEQNRLTTLSEINLSINNIYVSNLILNHNYTGIILFVAVLFFVYCIFYQDIESGMLPLFQSTKKALIKLYITKIAALIFAITTLILPMLVISQILIYITTGPSIPVQTFVGYLNYPYLVSVMGANLVSFIQVMLNTLVIASLLLLFIMVFRKYIFSLIVVGIVYILEYLAFSLISLNSSLRFLKTINLYSFLTRFNLSNELVSFGSYVIQLETLVKIVFSILIVLFLSISCFIYKKNSDQNYKINMISIKRKSRLPYVQELQQILIEKKGLLVIVILCSITVFRFINFNMVQNDWDREFMTVQKTYFGHITQDKISELDDEVHAIRMTKDKYDACLIGVEDCSKSTLDNYAETIKDLRYLEIIQEDYHSLDLSVNSYYIQRKPYEILYGSSSGFTTIVNFLSLMSITAYLSAVSLRRNESNEFDHIIISTKKGKYVSRKIRRNIVLFIAVMLLLLVEVFNILKVQKYYGSLTTLYNLSVLVNTTFKVDLPLFYYQVLNISIKILWMMSLVNLVYISERVRKNKSFLLIAFVGVWIVSVTIFKTITPNILNNPILLLLVVISLLVFNLSVYRQEYHDAKIRS